MNSTDFGAVKRALVLIFDMFGDPKVLVADNGPPFNGKPFKEFIEGRGIKYISTPPWHPQSNGLAERHVGKIKLFLRKAMLGCENSDDRFVLIEQINNALKYFRNTVDVNGWSPAQRMFSFTPIMGLFKFSKACQQPAGKLIQVNDDKKIADKRNVKSNVKSNVKIRPGCQFEVGETVWVKNLKDPGDVRKELKGQLSVRYLRWFIILMLVGVLEKFILIICRNIFSNISCTRNLIRYFTVLKLVRHRLTSWKLLFREDREG